MIMLAETSLFVRFHIALETKFTLDINHVLN